MLSSRALVLFSGGQDSTTCLAWALDRYQHVETIAFDYGQRHRIELEARLQVRARMVEMFPQWAAKLGEDHLIDLTVLGQMSDTALTSGAEIALTAAGLPNTFVPGRNLLFLTFASALGYRRELDIVVGGMCETDFSGYPDCRDDTVKALQVAVSLGMGRRVTFETPLMWIDKAQTWALAHRLGGDDLVQIIVAESHTCYLGERGELHSWGYGCGECPACVLRKAGHAKWLSSVAALS
jgi:7-cyano-7-deazaguanine synthase